MKVLICCSNLYEEELKQFHRNKNGFSLMVRDIAGSLSEFDDVYILTHVITKACNVKNVKFVSHRIADILLNTKYQNLFEGLKNCRSFSMPLSLRLRYIYYAIDKGAIAKTIRQIQPDIVSIHGIGYGTKPYIDICEKIKIPYTVTLHGLIGLDASVRAFKQDKQMEKDFLKESEKKKIPVSVISTGIKKRILSAYSLQQGENIHVILNGTNCRKHIASFKDIRKEYGIPDGQYLAIAVGNITKNKNQIQIVRAYDMLPSEIKDKLTILFLGREVDDGEIRRLISDKGYAKNLILCGFVERDEMADYYRCSDINLFVSLNDGFGLPIIEGYAYGLPTVTFSDLDAIEDLFCPDALVLSKGRSDQDLANAIEMALKKKWNQEKIVQFSQNYGLKDMARKYHTFFMEALKG